MEVDRRSFVDALLAAPGGVALLARLEAEHRPDVSWFQSPTDSDPESVARGASAVATMSFGRLLELAVEAAEALAGPWMPDAPASLVAAYRQAGARRPLAEAVTAHFGTRLHAPVDFGDQQWWDDAPEGRSDRALFRDFDYVYGNGEFTWSGLWTVSAPPADIHDALVSAWEMDRSPVSRWSLPVRPDARVWELHRPGDWARLVEAYPAVAVRPHDGWELPGPNQHGVAELLAVPGQHAVRAHLARHLLPEWTAVARDYDGVHLSWAGFLTTEGYVRDLGAGGATMLRYWRSERTLWLADVFGDPEPLGAPVLSGGVNGSLGTDARDDDVRRQQDRAVLTTLLGR